ncbi:MAG: hypothetical protein KBD53_08825, partial [Candidatus Omnitrophica bacterium]|nr:hypothetical protein [Candidatus Omnitrophota bacterium]
MKVKCRSFFIFAALLFAFIPNTAHSAKYEDRAFVKVTSQDSKIVEEALSGDARAISPTGGETDDPSIIGSVGNPDPASDCGNGICQVTESHQLCQVDCPSPYCGNGFCDAQYNENGQTCQPDCTITCGDGICQSDESHILCQMDCPSLYCGNGICETEYNENLTTCGPDCAVQNEIQMSGFVNEWVNGTLVPKAGVSVAIIKNGQVLETLTTNAAGQYTTSGLEGSADHYIRPSLPHYTFTLGGQPIPAGELGFGPIQPYQVQGQFIDFEAYQNEFQMSGFVNEWVNGTLVPKAGVSV